MIDLNGKDGLVRDIAKLSNAARRWWDAPELKAARSRLPTPHNITNVCVESCRDSNYEDASYLGGHVLMISLSINVIGAFLWLTL